MTPPPKTRQSLEMGRRAAPFRAFKAWVDVRELSSTAAKPHTTEKKMATQRNTLNSLQIRANGRAAGAERNALITMMARSAEAREQLVAMARLKDKPASAWRGFTTIIPDGPLDKVCSAFHKETDIPLELPYFSLLFFLSGYLLERGVKIEFAGKLRTPETWTILLAPSGSGKTFASGQIAEAAGFEADFPSCASGPAFFQALHEFSEQGKPKLWLEDEFAQKLRGIETPSNPLSEMKEHLLRAYDGKPVDRTTKKDGKVIVEDPRLAILGLNTDEGFYKTVSPESLVDGFAQRFAYVVAREDDERAFTDYPIYDEAALGKACRSAFEAIKAVPLHSAYRVDKEGEAAFRELFGKLFDGQVQKSFYRRAMWLAVKYALFFHILAGKTTDELDGIDFGYAGRLIQIHLNDVKVMLGEAMSDLARIVSKVDKLAAEYHAQGRTLTARDLVHKVHGLRSMSDAKAVLQAVIGCQ